MNKSINLLTLYDRKQDRSNSDQYSHFVCSSDEKDWVFLQKGLGISSEKSLVHLACRN